MNARIEQTLLDKLRQLPAERLAEVEDFGFPAHREGDRALTRAAQKLRKPHWPRCGRTWTTPTTTGYEFGDVVLVPFPFPFTDQSTAKQRPAVD